MIQGGFMTRKIEQVRFAESAPKKKRVAAYARVSSGKDAMLHSLSAQVSYYSDYIQNNGWEYAGVYADEAINKKAYYTLVCEECGKEFVSYGNNRRKYCCRTCYLIARRARSV